MFHTPECIRLDREYLEMYVDYTITYPQHCGTCEGWGVVGTGNIDNDTGFRDESICSDCIEEGRCPRCRAELTLDNICVKCDWRFGDNGLPESPECFCNYETQYELD
jgi:hypothetical protein